MSGERGRETAIGRRVMIAVAGVVILGILLGAHAYLARRMIFDLELNPSVSTVLAVGLGLLAMLLVLQPFAERFLSPSLARWIVGPASLWLGLAFLILVGLAMAEGVVGILKFSEPWVSVAGLDAGGFRAGMALAFALPATLLALREGLRPPRVRRVEVVLERWPRCSSPFRIVQISDIHLGSLRGRSFAGWLVNEVNRLSPDLIAITGDLVDGPAARLAGEVEPFRELKAPLGCYFVTGNHDHYMGAAEWTQVIRSLGIRVLSNEHTVVDGNGYSFVLAGVEDHHSRRLPGEGGEDLDKALTGVPPDLPLILLAHDPTTWKAASRCGVDLQLSGHTHGGQLWPFRYLVRLATPFVAGLYRRGLSVLYVSRGTGYWGPPMRLGAPSEITEVLIGGERE